MSTEFKLQLIINELQDLGYNEIADQLIQQEDNLLSWFFQTFKKSQFDLLDQYLTNIINQTENPVELINLLNYQGEFVKEYILILLYFIRRFNLVNQENQLEYLNNQLLPILDTINKQEVSEFINPTILSELNKQTELNDKSFQKYIIYSFFKDAPNLSTNLSTIIQQAVKYQQSQSPLFIPPRTKHDKLDEEIPPSMIFQNNFNCNLLHTLTYHQDEVWFVKFSPSGKFMVTGSLDGRLILYDVLNNFQLIKILEPTQQQEASKFVPFSSKPTSGKRKAIIYCCWDPTEKYIVSCCLDTVIRVWSIGDINKKRYTRSSSDLNVGDFKLMTCFTLGQDIKTWSCEFLPKNKRTTLNSNTPQFIVGSPDKFLKIFDCEGNELFDFYGNLDDEEEEESQSTDESKDVSMKDSENIENNYNRINDLAITPDGNYLITANNDRQLHFYTIPDILSDDATTRRVSSINLKDSLKGRLTSCSISSNGKYLLVSFAPEELQVWDISDDKPILYKKFFGHSQSTFIIRSTFGYLVEDTKQEELVISGAYDGSIYIWKLKTGQLIKRIKGHSKLCNAVDWNIRGTYTKGKDYGKIWASVSDDKLVKVWGI
ncbi:unnamed protein product [Candida verbasci]|uniref:Uncharacterized protein n=1 Tax=Candida verbasci TaxID=1227364 RepID=A0A9W4XNH5_9ASCO|nr:unnamed protein product [Candida verbasci]